VVAEREFTTAPLRPEGPGGEHGEFVWTNGSEEASLLTSIRTVIDSAQSSLILSSYSIVGMQETPGLLFDNICGAVKRGVQVQLFLRQRNASPEQMQDVIALHDAGVSIHADTRNHAKVAIADETHAVLFSANFDRNHGLDSGVEIGYRLAFPAAIAELLRYMQHAIQNANTEFVRNPTHRQLDGNLAARWCKPWPNDVQSDVECPVAVFSQFAAQSETAPCLFEIDSGSRVQLFLGDATVFMRLCDERLIVDEAPLQDCGEPPICSADRVGQWLRSVRGGGDTTSLRRGFFSGLLRGL
jgi:hypothetical protein